MTVSSEKRAIREAFGRASARYDEVAGVQRRIADALALRLPAGQPQRVLDAGCGTGYSTRLLARHYPEAQVFALDFSHAMAAQADAVRLAADIEALPLASGSIDVYCSSLAWQWTQTPLAIAEAARVLAPGGLLRVATLGPSSLHELKRAFSLIDSAAHVRSFESTDTHANCLTLAGLTDVHVSRETVMTHVPNVARLMMDLRQLGAHVIGAQRRRGLLGRHSWQCVEAEYETLREAPGLPVTYEAIWLSARKPEND